MTFYKDKSVINIKNAKYSVKATTRSSGFCPLTSKTDAIMKNMQKDNDAYVNERTKCIMFTLTIRNLKLSDFGRKYSCGLQQKLYKPYKSISSVQK